MKEPVTREPKEPVMEVHAKKLAVFRAELGPCDDDAYLWLNGAPAVQLRLNQTRTVQRTLEDGAYDIRFMVINSGGWGWKAKARILVNSQEVYSVDREGGSGLYTGPVLDESRQFTIRHGQLAEF